MEKDPRQIELDARYDEGIAWRNKARMEDLEWRQVLRNGDVEWRQVVRDEDRMWRARTERTGIRCHALTAATQSLRRGASPEEIFEAARKFENWLNRQEG